MKKRILIPGFILLAGGAYLLYAKAPKNDVPAVIGDAVAARPLPPTQTPAHPLLAEPQRSGMHSGSYNTDVSDYAGPVGHNTVAQHRSLGRIIGIAPNISFDEKGRVITVALNLNGVVLYALDPNTLETLASYKMPKKDNQDNSGGAYFHLDHKNRPILAPNDNTIKVLDLIETDKGLSWNVAENYPLGDLLPEDANIHDVMPDWDGHLWFVTTGNVIGYRNKATGKYHLYKFPVEDEVVQNSFAVDKHGVYMVSTHALYMFNIDETTHEPVPVWREAYERGAVQKVGTISHGSGTSPTLIGDDLISIADDGSPLTHVMVYKRSAEVEGSRVVCKEPIFKTGKSATENSLVGYGNALIVQNDFGHDYMGNALETEPGVTRVDINEDREGCRTVWESDMQSQSLPRLSTATGLVYVYTFKLPFDGAKTGGWYLTALDFETGEQLWDRLIGIGNGGFWDKYSSVTAPIVIGPDNAAYVGIRTGVLRIKDGD